MLDAPRIVQKASENLMVSVACRVSDWKLVTYVQEFVKKVGFVVFVQLWHRPFEMLVLEQCFPTFVRQRPGKLFYIRRGPGAQQIYS
jgi:hypothetical protein